MKKAKTQDESVSAAGKPRPDDLSAGEAGAQEPRQGQELEKLQTQAAKAQENWDRLVRVTAEFENFRKRAAREKEEAVRYANHKLLERLLPVLDSFDMAISAAGAHGPDASQSLKEGIELVLQQLKSVLTDAGLEEIEAHGKPFDPNLHEAVSQLETDDVEEGHVAQQVRKGYLLRDRLVRPSSVIVAKKPAA